MESEITREIIYIVLITVIVILISVVLSRRAAEKKKRVIEELLMICGGEPRLVSDCTVVRGLNRVPGIIALCSDKVLFRSFILDISGEIPLANIERVEAKRSLAYSRSYRKIVAGTRVLEVATSCEVYCFFIKRADIAAWMDALQAGSK